MTQLFWVESIWSTIGRTEVQIINSELNRGRRGHLRVFLSSVRHPEKWAILLTALLANLTIISGLIFASHVNREFR